MDMQFGLGLKLALGGFLKKLRFDKLKTQHATSRYENIFSWRVAKNKELGKIARLSTDKMDKLTKSINKLNQLDIKAGLAREKLQAFKDDLGKNIAKMDIIKSILYMYIVLK